MFVKEGTKGKSWRGKNRGRIQLGHPSPPSNKITGLGISKDAKNPWRGSVWTSKRIRTRL